RSAEQMALAVGVARFPQAPGLLDAIAERVHDEHRGGHQEALLGDAREIGPADALAARHAVHIEQEGVDPLNRWIGLEEGLCLVCGEPPGRHDACPLAAAPNRRNRDLEISLERADHSGCHCTPRQKAASSGPRTASIRPSSAKASGLSPSPRRAMPCPCSELTMISSRPIQSRSLPRKVTG